MVILVFNLMARRQDVLEQVRSQGAIRRGLPAPTRRRLAFPPSWIGCAGYYVVRIAYKGEGPTVPIVWQIRNCRTKNVFKKDCPSEGVDVWMCIILEFVNETLA